MKDNLSPDQTILSVFLIVNISGLLLDNVSPFPCWGTGWLVVFITKNVGKNSE